MWISKLHYMDIGCPFLVAWSLIWEHHLAQKCQNHGLEVTVNVKSKFSHGFESNQSLSHPSLNPQSFPFSYSQSPSNKSGKPCYGYSNLLINFSAALIYSVTAAAPQWQEVLQAGGQFDWESNRAWDLAALQQGEINAPVCEKSCIYNTHMPE